VKEDMREPRTGVEELLSNMFSDWLMMIEFEDNLYKVVP